MIGPKAAAQRPFSSRTVCTHQRSQQASIVGRRSAGRVLVHAQGDNEAQGNWFTRMFNSITDFDSWAPRSSRFWRLRQYDYESSTQTDDESESLADLEARLKRASEGMKNASSSAPSAPAYARREETSTPPSPSAVPGGATSGGSFSDIEDGALASALSRRIQEISGSSMTEEDDEGEMVELEPAAEPEKPITAEELRLLIFKKYGKSYDMSIVRRDIPGKTFVCLNVMWHHLEQRSFRLTDEQYMEKLDSICYMVNAVAQADVVRSTLMAPAKSMNGMPSRPVVGTAISIKLDVNESTVEQWFGRGFQ